MTEVYGNLDIAAFVRTFYHFSKMRNDNRSVSMKQVLQSDAVAVGIDVNDVNLKICLK